MALQLFATFRDVMMVILLISINQPVAVSPAKWEPTPSKFVLTRLSVQWLTGGIKQMAKYVASEYLHNFMENKPIGTPEIGF